MKKILIKAKIIKTISTEAELISCLGVVGDTYNKCCRIAPLFYRQIFLPKKDGGYREISAPKEDLKSIQRAVLDKIFIDIKLPPCVYGFSRGKTIIENARYHAHSDYLINLDIKNFFPSVHFKRVLQMYKDMGFNDVISDILCKLTTYNHKLPQGAPTSPFLASIALTNLDYRLYKLAKENHISYSRYFDDLCFSGGKRVMVLENDIFQIIKEEGYIVKKSKRDMFTKGEVKNINGISILPNGKLFLDNSGELVLYITELKEFGISRLRSDNPEKERSSIIGKITFLKKIDPIKGLAAENVFSSIEW